ncbi:hypothetical protein MJ561_20380 [Klebsiella pneumoniae]|nr:hypothetical protein MJ561_20380 [Klebsiella pneumoniae]
MLNGSHSSSPGLAIWQGMRTLGRLQVDDVFRRAARQLMLDEQVPTLTITGVDLLACAGQSPARFSNRRQTPHLANRHGR